MCWHFYACTSICYPILYIISLCVHYSRYFETTLLESLSRSPLKHEYLGFDNCHRDKRKVTSEKVIYSTRLFLKCLFIPSPTVTKVCIATALSSLSFLSYCAIMLEKSRPIPLNNSNDSTEKEIADIFPEVYTVPEDESVVALSLSREKGHPLYCHTCSSNRPERAHHCKECNRCAYKMDQ